jgi:hypothetical protein
MRGKWFEVNDLKHSTTLHGAWSRENVRSCIPSLPLNVYMCAQVLCMNTHFCKRTGHAGFKKKGFQNIFFQAIG